MKMARGIYGEFPEAELVNSAQASIIPKINIRSSKNLPEQLFFKPVPRDPEISLEEHAHFEGETAVSSPSDELDDAARRLLFTTVGLISEEEWKFIHEAGMHCEHCFVGGETREERRWYCSRPCD